MKGCITIMKDEIRKILKMIEDGHITAEEGENLIEALGSNQDGALSQGLSVSDSSTQFLKVRVVEEGKDKVNVSIPLSLVEIGLKLGAKIGPTFASEAEVLQNIDLDELMQAIKEGARGKIVDIDNDDSKVEVFIE